MKAKNDHNVKRGMTSGGLFDISFQSFYHALMTPMLAEQLKNLPPKPGCYIFKDVDGRILYIGKAKSLRSRVRSYFAASANLESPKQIMVQKVYALETIRVSTEHDALLLESTLIRKHEPPFNVQLKDDKSWVYIKVTLEEEFPRVIVVRRPSILHGHGTQPRYFGPYTSAGSVRATLHLLKKLFPYRICNVLPKRPCLEYHLKRCPAPCIEKISKEDYRAIIDHVIEFLEGKTDALRLELQKQMEAAVGEQAFERAARFRDQIRSIEHVTRTRTALPTLGHENMDILSLALDPPLGAINLFMIRDGKLITKQVFTLTHVHGVSDEELLTSFLKQYYPSATDIPNEIVTPVVLADPSLPAAIQTWRTMVMPQLPSSPIHLTVPRRGVKRNILHLGNLNAQEFLAHQRTAFERDEQKAQRALTELAEALQLPLPPKRIEVYDISNIQGTSPVGSMIVFEDGLPKKDAYRKFHIKNVQGANDYAMLQEVLERRLAKHGDRPGESTDRKAWPIPDLIILDGGKGQLHAVEPMIHYYHPDLPVIALAKRQEEIFRVGTSEPLLLPRTSEALYLIQRMRDEAHRFAITFFRKTHGRKLVGSRLDAIPGIGPITRRKLFERFGSLQQIKLASEEEIAELVGQKTAERLKEYL
jgi:excinuclease ABC subunit C